MAIYKSDIVDINLETGSIHRSFLKHAIGTADQAADRFGIRAFRDGAPVDLSGASCYGYFRNSHGTNIALTSNGTVSGNVAYVTLPQACYNYEGNFTLAIKLLVSGVTSTVRIIDGVVDNTNTGSAVAPTSAVPTYSEILEQYDAMVAATAVANGAIATTFNAATVYPAGSYVINDSALYRITADHAANVTWANTSKVATNFGAEVTALKSAIKNLAWTEETCSFVTGKYIKTNGDVGSTVDVETPVSSSNYAYSIAKCRKGDLFEVRGAGGDAPRMWCFTDNDYRMLSKSGNNASGTVSLTANADGYLITNTTTAATHYLKHWYYYENIPALDGDVNTIKTKIENIIYATKLSPTYLKHRYLKDNGTPTTTTSNAWNLYKLDVSQCDLVYVNTYKTSTSSLVMWSFTTVDYNTATEENIGSSTIVGKSAKTSSTGEIAAKVSIPTGAKTMLIACASAYSASYPVTYIYNYSVFQELKEVPSIITGITALNTKTAGLEVYNTSAYYRKVRWGCPEFCKYYHSADNGTSEFPSTTTAAQYFTKFNELVSDYTGYAESHEMGLASDGTTMMYYYTFAPKTNQDSTTYKRPKIIVSAGQHGFEKTANFGVYYFAKDLLENWEGNPFLDYLRNHVQIILMPMLNPWGFDNDKYVNANGVNLNRNWDTTGWSSGTPGTTTYGGEEPLDQPETQYASAVILANLDALWLCDYHNNGQVAPTGQTGYLWHSFALVIYDDKYFEKSIQAAKWHIDETTGHLYKDYPGIVTYANCGTFTDDNAPSHQGLIVAYAREHNIMAATMEGGAAFIDSGSRYSSPIGHMNADLLGNWIRCLLATYSHYADN